MPAAVRIIFHRRRQPAERQSGPRRIQPSWNRRTPERRLPARHRIQAKASRNGFPYPACPHRTANRVNETLRRGGLGGDLKSTSECLIAPRPSRKRLGACRLCAAGRGDETSPLVRHFFFGHMDAVSAGVFRTVQRRIRAREQGIKCRDRLVSDSRADADGGANSVGGDGRPRKFETRSYAFADFASALRASWDDRDKLFAAKPGDDVVGTRARSHHLSENTQDFIAQGVPETVVDRFEMIEIEHQQGHRLPASACCAYRVSAFSIKAGRLSRPVRWSVQAAVR